MSSNHLGLGTAPRLKVAVLASLLVIAGVLLLAAANGAHESVRGFLPVPGWEGTTSAIAHRNLATVGQSALFFEPNQGQTDPQVKFMSRGSGYSLFLTANQAVLKLQDRGSMRASSVAMHLVGSNPAAVIQGRQPLPGKSNYLIGKDPAKWRTGLPQFGQVRYEQVYPGIDLLYYGRQGQLEYDFEVAPGSDANQIVLSFTGADRLTVTSRGVEMMTPAGAVHFESPRVYQNIGPETRPVQGRFVLLAENKVGFELGAYDRNQPLVIDPVLSYSTYLGGTGTEASPKIAVDSGLNFYIAGTTTSADFPGTSVSGRPEGPSDTFVAKFNSTGSALDFATYLGGDGTETVAGIGVDGGFNVYVGGTTTSSDFPTQATAFQSPPVAAGSHVYVSQLNATGSTLLYSTYLAGSKNDIATGFTIDNRGNAYVTGTTTSSTDFPITLGAFPWPPANPAIQFFISKVNTAGSGASSLPYSSYFGGGSPASGTAIGGGIAVDASGNIYFTGSTNFRHVGTITTPDLNDFPILNATQSCLDTPTPVPPPTTAPTCNNGLTALDAFVAKIAPPNGSAGPQLVYSTYLGGADVDQGIAIAVDSGNNAYVTGTTSSVDLKTSTPTTIKPYQADLDCPKGTADPSCASQANSDAFVAKIGGTQNSTTSIYPLNYFSYLGGQGDETGLAIAVDTSQVVRVTGSTNSTNFPLTTTPAPSPAPTPVQATLQGGLDAFVARIDTTATTTSSPGQWGTYLGGSGNDVGTGVIVDANNQTYVTGQTASANFPKANPFQATLKGTSDAFLSKLGAASTLTLSGVPSPASVGVGNALTFKYTITNTGPDPAFNVTFSDVLPTSGATFSSATASPGSCTGATGTPPTITCAVGTMNVGATATVSIVVTPTSIAPGGLGNSATVTFNNGTTVSASVSPIPPVTDFRVDATPSSATVVAGNTATYTITVTPLPTYSGSVALSCSSGLPSAASCTFTSSPVTLPNTSPVTAQLAISTTARPSSIAQLRWNRWLYALWLPLMGIALGGSSRLRRRWLLALFTISLLGAVAFQAGCGSDSVAPPTTPGTPAGTYTITVSGSSGSASRTNVLTLVVQ